MNKTRITRYIVLIALSCSSLNAVEKEMSSLSLMPKENSKLNLSGKIYFISGKGTVVECKIENELLSLTVIQFGQESEIHNLSKSQSDPGDNYANEEIKFFINDNKAVMIFKDKEEEMLVAADKYSGELPDKNGTLLFNEIYFSDAVNVIYVLKSDKKIMRGNWYLLKGEPLENDSGYNTTLYEMLLSDNKTEFKCFMQDITNPQKLILLDGDCSVVKPTQYFILKDAD